ncbi:MAG: dTDP-4-dehydrorhamnose 3,5-epimerase family protein [Bryobacteraceae bacterium]|jgi:dTDP-4-dehydrorhamnose 3,5-epimerase
MQSPGVCLIKGNVAFDDRGSISFVNDFSFAGVKRSYAVRNHSTGVIRAWHAHRREAKYVAVVEGAAIVGAVQIDDWESPSADATPARYVLASGAPSVLYIPAGYANGFRTLTENTIVVFFSTSSLEDSVGDDTRFDARYWDIWNVTDR